MKDERGGREGGQRSEVRGRRFRLRYTTSYGATSRGQLAVGEEAGERMNCRTRQRVCVPASRRTRFV